LNPIALSSPAGKLAVSMTTHNYSAGMASDAFDGLAWQEPPSQNQMPIRATEMVSGSGAPRVCDMCMLCDLSNPS